MAQEQAPDSAAPGVILDRGQTISRFVVLGLVGRGGMGEVYAAYDPELDRKVAIKLLRAQGQKKEDGEDRKLRLLREAQATAKLQHPNVVVVYDVGTFGENVFIAMEFVEGQTMSAWLGAAPRSRREIVDVYLAAGRGLSAAHAAGLVHRDFKPDNVMVTNDGQVRVMDFGLARHVDDPKAEAAAPSEPMPEGDAASSGRYLAVKLTQTGAMLGTPAYMAPEQFAGAPTDARTDQFSFCVALYEALYGARPFEGDSFLALMTNVTTGALGPVPPKAGVPAWTRKVLLRGLATTADRRFPSMAALLAALQTDPTARTRRLVAAGLALVAVVALIYGGRRAAVEGRAPLCGAGTQRIPSVWGAAGTPSPRRVAIARAFSATRDPFAKQAFAAVARYLDGYSSAWVSAYADACEATHVRGEQSSEVLDLRMGCLNDRLVELRALTDVLAGADAKVVQNAVSGVSTLGPIDRCGDVRLLRALVRPPSDQATSKRVEELQGQKARLYASTVKARCKTTHAIESDVLAGARAVKYGPLLAETLLACGKVEDTCGASAETLVGFYQEAFTTALSSGHDQVAAESAALIASTLADKERQLPAARQWHAISHAIVTHMGGAPLVEVALDQAEGLIAQHAHEKDASLAALERARAGTAKLRGPEHPFVGLILNAEGLTLHDAGEEKRALDLLRSAEEILWNVVGPDHPWVAGVLANEGDVLNAMRHYVEAHAAFEMALTIWMKEKAEPARVAFAQTGLGVALLGEGKAHEAIEPLEQALAARAEKTTPPELAGETRFALARAAWSKPSERGRAVSLARAARHDYEGMSDGAAQAQVAAIDAWLRAPAAKL
jgi:tRNA A-37 threonylcarbamoyl transferase component Bud32/tetratricopeptide (TPR) repeat protein